MPSPPERTRATACVTCGKFPRVMRSNPITGAHGRSGGQSQIEGVPARSGSNGRTGSGWPHPASGCPHMAYRFRAIAPKAPVLRLVREDCITGRHSRSIHAGGGCPPTWAVHFFAETEQGSTSGRIGAPLKQPPGRMPRIAPGGWLSPTAMVSVVRILSGCCDFVKRNAQPRVFVCMAFGMNVIIFITFRVARWVCHPSRLQTATPRRG